ncbi:MAG: 1-acyl-sn-glycerol-3-phosphate acyltransferase [Planctomycetaceae bacterium]|nr:1-acyl-sn-glycerol-3-phosphate acyltransferase [Planctomycetaceae bacterium]
MSPDVSARCTVAGYLLLAVLIVVWRAGRCPEGWRLWLLYTLNATYCRLGFHWRANRKCPFLEARPGIILANHRSPLDPLLIWVGVTNRRPIEFITAGEYFGIHGLQFILGAQRCIPVARDGKDMVATRTAARRLREGRLVGVFPEGGINVGTGMRPFNPGIAWLALQAQSPVYPVFIENAPQGTSMIAPFWSFRPIRVHYGEAIDLSEFINRRRTPELLEQVTALLRAKLAELGGIEPAAVPEDDQPQVLPLERRVIDQARSANA